MEMTPELEAAAKVLGWPEWRAYSAIRWIRPCSNGSYQEIGLHADSIYPDEAEDFDSATIAPVLADRWLAELRLRAEKRQMFVTYSSGGGGDCAVYISQAHSGDEICVGTGDALLGAVVEAAIQFGEWEAKR